MHNKLASFHAPFLVFPPCPFHLLVFPFAKDLQLHVQEAWRRPVACQSLSAGGGFAFQRFPWPVGTALVLSGQAVLSGWKGVACTQGQLVLETSYRSSTEWLTAHCRAGPLSSVQEVAEALSEGGAWAGSGCSRSFHPPALALPFPEPALAGDQVRNAAHSQVLLWLPGFSSLGERPGAEGHERLILLCFPQESGSRGKACCFSVAVLPSVGSKTEARNKAVLPSLGLHHDLPGAQAFLGTPI